MKGAAAIVTDRGGRTCHAAIVARELGVPAVVGAERDASELKTGWQVTVDVPEAKSARSMRALAFEVTRQRPHRSPQTATPIMLNVGNPELAFQHAMLPNDGVGLARMEFIISEHIGVHPMALAASRSSDIARGPRSDRPSRATLCETRRLFHRAARGGRRHHRRPRFIRSR